MTLELNAAERLTLQELSLHHRYADFRRRTLSILALAKGHPLPLVADILGVTPQTVYHWLKAWRTIGLMGLLQGHQGGAPAKLTAVLLDTAEAVARAAPATLADARQVHEAHPEAPDFSLDRLSAGSRSHAPACP
jgi:transposase